MNIKMRCETVKITHMEKSLNFLNCLSFGKHLNFIEFFCKVWKIMEFFFNFGEAFSFTSSTIQNSSSISCKNPMFPIFKLNFSINNFPSNFFNFLIFHLLVIQFPCFHDKRTDIFPLFSNSIVGSCFYGNFNLFCGGFSSTE